MGFLDHSTNNIIVDAVLTKKGREYLAQNNGDFNITHFSLGDDEVDYNIIKQYGRTVGKEKIEKNTPVLEAVTSSDGALRYRLLTINENVLYYPQINISSNNLTADVLSLRTSTNTNTTLYNTQEDVVFKIKTTDSRRTAASFVNNVYRVELDSSILSITSNATAEKTDSFDKRTTYTVISNAVGSNNESELSFTLAVKSGISTSTTEFDKYKTANQTYIRTFVRMTSNQTGLTKIFEVKIYGS